MLAAPKIRFHDQQAATASARSAPRAAAPVWRREPEDPAPCPQVLSPTAADHDPGGKFARYRQIPSLRDYLAVAQDRIEVLYYRRQDTRPWLLTELADPAAILELPDLDCRLALAEIYDKVFTA